MLRHFSCTLTTINLGFPARQSAWKNLIAHPPSYITNFKMQKMSSSSQSVSEQFDESDLNALKQNPDQPKHRSMKMIGEITLDKVSAFKLSERQKSSLADFMSEPWPKKGDVPQATFNDPMKLFETLFLSKPVSVEKAFGFMTVMGAWSAAIRVKLSKLLAERPDDSDINLLLEESDNRAGTVRNYIVERICNASSRCPEEDLEPGNITSAHRNSLIASFDTAHETSKKRWIEVAEVNVGTGAESRFEPSSFATRVTLSSRNSRNSISLFSSVPSIATASVKTQMMKTYKGIRKALEPGISPRQERELRLIRERIAIQARIDRELEETVARTSTVCAKTISTVSDAERQEQYVEPSSGTSLSDMRSKELHLQSLPEDGATSTRSVDLFKVGDKVRSWPPNPDEW